MIINRVWAMPNKWTFQIKPIKQLIKRYIGDGVDWIDPFAANSTLTGYTNDINPNTSAKHHLDALLFLKMLNGKFPGILFDPIYSPRQMKECYDSINLKMSFDDSNKFPSNVKDVATTLIKPGGYAICFGWNSGGFGKGRGYKLIEILMVCHGGNHNDTIVTVEQKINQVL